MYAESLQDFPTDPLLPAVRGASDSLPFSLAVYVMWSVTVMQFTYHAGACTPTLTKSPVSTLCCLQ